MEDAREVVVWKVLSLFILVSILVFVEDAREVEVDFQFENGEGVSILVFVEDAREECFHDCVF